MRLTLTDDNGCVYTLSTVLPYLELTPTTPLMKVELEDDDGDLTTLDELLIGCSKWEKGASE